MEHPRVWSIWVKAPMLKGAELLIASACLPYVNRRVFEELAKGRVVLLACPEGESPAHYGKIASIIRSSKPRKLIVATVEGSPHCFALHASVNEAEYILNEKVEREHYVLVDAKKLVRISPSAVRVARYLHIVEKLVKEHPEVLNELKKHSLEHSLALKREGKRGSFEVSSGCGSGER